MTKLNDKNKTENTENMASSDVNALVMPHPHLFANGKFRTQFQIEGTGHNTPLIQTVEFKILGYKDDRFLVLGYNMPIQKCKLIARPISDMSSEELIKFDGILIDIDMKDAIDTIELNCNGNRLSIKEALLLIDMGIYPFNQSHFEQDWLIDARAV